MARRLATTLALCATIFLSGCISRPSLVRQSFCFTAPAVTAPNAAPGSQVLSIRQLLVAPPFDSQSLVYRTGEFSYERDPYAQFLVAPEASIMPPIRAYFLESGAFGEVAEPGSALAPDMFAEITVCQLYGDFRNLQDPYAMLAMRFLFFNASNGMPGKLILDQEFSRRIHLKQRTAAAVVAGWNEALSQIMTEVTSLLNRRQEPRTASGNQR